MKKALLIALVLTLSAGLAVAQQHGGPGSNQGGKGQAGNSQARERSHPVDRLTENLGLDEAQAAEITLIFEEAQLVRAEEREKSCVIMEENRANTHAQILEVLTPEQAALFQEQHQKREDLRQALEDVRADRGFGGGRGKGDCNG